MGTRHVLCRDSWHGRVAQPCGFVGAVRLLFRAASIPGVGLGSRYVEMTNVGTASHAGNRE
jgi:hypothetical protein